MNTHKARIRASLANCLNRMLAVAAFTYAMTMTSVGFADIAPPPPDIPGTDLQMPQPGLIAIAGLFIAAAIVMAGIMINRRSSPAASRPLLIGGVLLAIVVAGCAVFAAREYSDYDERLENWEPLGPVPERDVDVSPVDQSQSAIDVLNNDGSSHSVENAHPTGA